VKPRSPEQSFHRPPKIPNSKASEPWKFTGSLGLAPRRLQPGRVFTSPGIPVGFTPDVPLGFIPDVPLGFIPDVPLGFIPDVPSILMSAPLSLTPIPLGLAPVLGTPSRQASVRPNLTPAPPASAPRQTSRLVPDALDADRPFLEAR